MAMTQRKQRWAGAHLCGDLLALLPGRALGDDLLHQDERDGAAQAAHGCEDDLGAAHCCARRIKLVSL